MKIIPLPFETVALTGWTHKVSIFAADLTAAAGSQTFTIFPDGSADGYYSNGAAIQDATLAQLPAGFQVEKSQIRVVQTFTGGAISAATIGRTRGGSSWNRKTQAMASRLASAKGSRSAAACTPGAPLRALASAR